MKTEGEEKKMKMIEESLSQVVLQIDGADPDESMLAMFVGAPMGVIDALFAIRDNEEWRGTTDPSEMARIALKSIGIGE